MDTVERLKVDDLLRQAAIVMATFAANAANLTENSGRLAKADTFAREQGPRHPLVRRP
jgi:hypothetical protein